MISAFSDLLTKQLNSLFPVLEVLQQPASGSLGVPVDWEKDAADFRGNIVVVKAYI